MDIIFLGTGSMMPTKERAQTALLLRYWEECFLFDCGEGTQRQMRLAGISPARVTKIFLTHWHGDHFFGLPGLFENIAKHSQEKSVELYGPKGTSAKIKKLMDSFLLQHKITVHVKEINKEGIFLEGKKYVMKATRLSHSVPCLAYTFEEKGRRKIRLDYLKKKNIPEGPLLRKLQEGNNIIYQGKKIDYKKATFLEEGKKIAVVLDTKMCPGIVKAAKGADLLICESTFSHDMASKAKEYYHLTSQQAAQCAKKAGVKKLILTHFSQRYTDTHTILADARKIFTNTAAAEDFMSLTL